MSRHPNDAPPGPKLRISRANKISADELLRIAQASTPDAIQHLPLEVLTSPFNTADRDDIWAIFEANMRALYEGSHGGWKPSKKRKELFHVDSRYLVLRSAPAQAEQSQMLGYLMWRFDGEEDLEGVRQPVIYLYELSVASSAQGRGLGRALVQLVSSIGARADMSKVILTVFKANSAALSFYQRLGFGVDEISPSRCLEKSEMDTSDYEILSLQIKPV